MKKARKETKLKKILSKLVKSLEKIQPLLKNDSET